MKKTCSRCRIEKTQEEFPKDKTKKDGFGYACKQCISKYYHMNKDWISLRHKEYDQKNRDKIRIRKKNGYEKNKEAIWVRQKNYNLKNKEKTRIRKKTRYQTDLQYRLSEILRSRLSVALKGNFKAGSAVRDLGCSIEYLKKYLEEKFTDGMCWDNYGLQGWTIDHKVPLASFDLADREQLLKACHYTNLQPLWWYENLAKRDKLDWTPTC